MDNLHDKPEQEQLMSDQINYGMSVTQGGKRIDPMSIYKEPEQEPVAWMDDYNACKCPDNEARCFSDKVFRMMQKHTDSLVKRQEPVAKVCHDLDGHIGWNPNLKQLPNEGTPLYTTPPQRKPLTDEEKDRLANAWFSKDGDTDVAHRKAISLIEEVEAAHGIKVEA